MVHSSSNVPADSHRVAKTDPMDIVNYYDRLPPEVRRAMQRANHNYGDRQVYELVGQFSQAYVIGLIRRNDQSTAKEHYASLGQEPHFVVYGSRRAR